MDKKKKNLQKEEVLEDFIKKNGIILASPEEIEELEKISEDEEKTDFSWEDIKNGIH